MNRFELFHDVESFLTLLSSIVFEGLNVYISFDYSNSLTKDGFCYWLTYFVKLPNPKSFPVFEGLKSFEAIKEK